jgi:predicted phosphodiesterase
VDDSGDRSLLRGSRRAFLGFVAAGAATASVAGAVAWRFLQDATQAGTAPVFARGPYLTSVGAHDAELRWLTRSGTPAELVATAPDGTVVRGTGGRLASLAAGTRYAWSARVDGQEAASGSFSTAPDRADAPVTFGVIGDYGSGNAHEVAVGRVALEQEPGFMVTAGDNSYLVAAEALLDRNIFTPLAPLLAIAPLYVCVGDHDEFWPGPGALLGAFGQQRFQDVRFGGVQVVICGDRAGADGAARAREALAAAGPRVRFVVQHRPPQIGDPLIAAARDGGAAAIFAGHLHRYERRVVDGMLTFTVGTGGQGPGSLEATPRSPEASVSLLDYGHLRVDVGADGAVRYRFLDEHGRLLDDHTAAGAPA